MVIKINESLLFKIKYDRVDLKESKFCLWNYRTERNGLCHIQVKRNRKAETLLSIIYDDSNEGS